jgi:hypothetical protein
MKQIPTFETIGYSVDYFIENKFVGSIKIEEPDREIVGYSGRRFETLTDNITLSNKKVLKKGVQVKTELVQLFGKKSN